MEGPLLYLEQLSLTLHCHEQGCQNGALQVQDEIRSPHMRSDLIKSHHSIPSTCTKPRCKAHT